jgi:hypothetical protein
VRARSLRGRLVGASVVWAVVVLATGGVVLSLALRQALEGAFRSRLDSLLVAVVAALDVAPDVPARVTRAIPDPRFDRAYSGWYWQVADGPTLLRSRSLWDATLPVGGPQVLAGPRGEPLLAVNRQLRYPSRAAPLEVVVAGPAGELAADVARFDRLLAISLGALGLGSASRCRSGTASGRCAASPPSCGRSARARGSGSRPISRARSRRSRRR